MKLVFATNNRNKLSEIKSLVTNEIEILSLKDINCFDKLPLTLKQILNYNQKYNTNKINIPLLVLFRRVFFQSIFYTVLSSK